MRYEEYVNYDATGLAALVASKQVTPSELLDIAMRLAERHQSTLNFITVWAEARARAKLAEPLRGPFAGVPFLVKDIEQDMVGYPSAAGSKALKGLISSQDSEYVRRAEAAGLLIFGKTATPEFALKGVTEPSVFGPTRNPVQLDRSPGGSSGGSAAAVAAGVVPMAGANDGGGSIRIPAAYCGLFGLRPSRGRVPCGPALGEVWDGASSDLILGKSVRDAAKMLDVLSGGDPGAPFEIIAPSMPFADLAARPVGRLRIAYSTQHPMGGMVNPELVAATVATANLLREMGHIVEEDQPDIDGYALSRSFLYMYFGQTAASVAEALDQGASMSDFEEDTLALDLLGRTITAGEYVRERRNWNGYSRSLGRFYSRYDLYLTPTTADVAPRIGELATPAWKMFAVRALRALNAGKALLKSGQVDEMAQKNLERTPFTQLANLTGTPSMSCPMAISSEGLPIGVQFNAPFGHEGRLLALAQTLESAFQYSKPLL